MRCFFSKPWVISFHSISNTDQLSAEYSRGTLCRYLVFSLQVALFSLVLCPVNSRCFASFVLSSHLFFFRNSPDSTWIFPSCTVACSLLIVDYVKNKGSPQLFLFVRDHHCSSHNIQCLENYCIMWFIHFFTCFSKKGKSVKSRGAKILFWNTVHQLTCPMWQSQYFWRITI